MSNPGELLCMALFGVFVALVLNAKAERAGGWGNYLFGCAILLAIFALGGLLAKGCKAASGS